MSMSRDLKPAVETPTKTVDDYLAEAPVNVRAALAKLRKTIKSTAPAAVESISYGVAGFKYKNKPLVYFGYWKAHCSLYGIRSRFVEAHAEELAGYELHKGSIRFTPEQPLSLDLIRKLVRSRVAEIEQSS